MYLSNYPSIYLIYTASIFLPCSTYVSIDLSICLSFHLSMKPEYMQVVHEYIYRTWIKIRSPKLPASPKNCVTEQVLRTTVWRSQLIRAKEMINDPSTIQPLRETMIPCDEFHRFTMFHPSLRRRASTSKRREDTMSRTSAVISHWLQGPSGKGILGGRIDELLILV